MLNNDYQRLAQVVADNSQCYVREVPDGYEVEAVFADHIRLTHITRGCDLMFAKEQALMRLSLRMASIYDQVSAIIEGSADKTLQADIPFC